ncbi:hypothetical protein HZH68_016247 [Vespula germanica]|uniref:Uncharacterized protein n=1 Tax=Vespula germanica TaxID=30212 RepID=A0A834J4F1_VESGE|nr:hypothetical protein HZH68_016247 [Vespula germanica]
MATEVLLLMRGTLGLLTAAILKNRALHVIHHLLCQIVKRAEEADAGYEFITNLANNLKPKLVREEANYVVYESIMLLLLEHYYSNHRLLNFDTRVAKRSNITHWIVVAEMWFKKQLEILTNEGISSAIALACIM